MRILDKIWNKRKIPKHLPDICIGWNHGLIEVKNQIRYGAFLNVYHLYPGGGYSPQPLWAFSDNTIYLQLQWGESCRTLERLQELLEDQTIVVFPPEHSQIVDLSRSLYQVVQIDCRVDSNDLALEIKDLWRQLRNELDSLDLCRLAIRKYCEKTTEDNLLNLKETYFRIPHNRRSFLISMDAKDHLVRQILTLEDKSQLESLTQQLKEEIGYS